MHLHVNKQQNCCHRAWWHGSIQQPVTQMEYDYLDNELYFDSTDEKRVCVIPYILSLYSSRYGFQLNN